MGCRTREPGSKHYQLLLTPEMRNAIELKRDEMSEGRDKPLNLLQTITHLLYIGLAKS
jgi:hypothetical protein